MAHHHSFGNLASASSSPQQQSMEGGGSFRKSKCGESALKCVDTFVQEMEEWVSSNMKAFECPFSIEEVREVDAASEGVFFRQLIRMPPSGGAVSRDHFLAVHDFLQATFTALWHTFWHTTRPPPFFLACPRRRPRSRFYTLDKAISRGTLHDLSGFALMSAHPRLRWDHALHFVLFKPRITASASATALSAHVLCEALFYGLHLLISTHSPDPAFLLLLDPTYGAVVTLSGDLTQLSFNSSDPYLSAVHWIKNHAHIRVSPVHLVWNTLGNPNWRDLGALQLVLATFYSIAHWSGSPRKPIASDHSLSLRLPRHLTHDSESASQEIVEEPDCKKGSRLKLNEGEAIVVDHGLEGQNKTFRIRESAIGGNHFLYSAVSDDDPTKLLALYVGAHPSRLEPSWEDMSLWYQVQRQTKVLNILKQQGAAGSTKYLPEMVASGRILHSGTCEKQGTSGRCDHPWCGTPILVTSPVGEPLSCVVEREGCLTWEEAVRCCRDCLEALSSAARANVQHGDVCPESIIRVSDGDKGNRHWYVPKGWGRAVVEERDSAAVNLQFSSGHALQHGKVCPSSDVESLMYVLLYACGGGSVEQLDSIEAALQWRETMWAQRTLQQRLGEVCPILKAFADYVDTLCATPYPVDYQFWLARFATALHHP